MTTTSSSASSAPRPVVGAAPKMPKVKYSSKVMAHINAFSIAFAIFLGLAAIFAAIAGFTKNAKMPWSFGVPFIGTFLGNNLYGGSALFVRGSIFSTIVLGRETLFNHVLADEYCEQSGHGYSLV